ncbi:lethal giant larvae like, C-terminal-domain-containing protein [Tuber brumale]|nr:lethal giant larvae like, C-terminal-domain-containing protein [Tuber brumale]
MDFLRSKQAGIQHDFTGALAAPDLFVLDEVEKYGIESSISALAYDPIQSLLAVGTNETATTPGKVYVFGQKRVQVTFTLTRKAGVKFLKLCDSRIVVVDTKSELSVFDMADPEAQPARYSPPGIVSAVLTDPSLDWVFMGLQNGEVVAYDLDRQLRSPFLVPNLWRERSPKARVLPIVSLALHPRDLGTLLIGYLEGCVVFSLKQHAPTLHLQFEIPPGAPGADPERSMLNSVRRPRLCEALWHPTGTFICTTHEDSCLVIWDSRDGRVVQARTLQDTNVNIPCGPQPGIPSETEGTIIVRQPLFKVSWCCTDNPDDTSILVAGGNLSVMPNKGLTLLDLGPTPNMLTSSIQLVSDHFASPRRQRVLPTPADLDVVDFCLLPQTSPHYAGSHDPVAVIALLASGELVTLSFPDGQPISPALVFHPSLSLIHPRVTTANLSPINRQRWLGMIESRDGPKEVIIGGVEHVKPLRRYENRTVLQTAHLDGTVKIWDLGLADEIENEKIMEVDLGQVLERGVDLKIERVAMAGSTGELAVGMETGEVVLFRWGKNKGYGRIREDEALQSMSRTESGSPTGTVRDAKSKSNPTLKEGLLPLCVLEEHCGSVLYLSCSDVGFVAIAYQTGHVSVVDLRGPAVIFHQSLTSLTKEAKRSSFRKSHDKPMEGEKATCLEFGVLTLEGDGKQLITNTLEHLLIFSSIALFVGTSHGRIATFKILPQGPGFVCNFVNITCMEGPVIKIIPLNSDSGKRAYATQQAVADLRNGIKVPGVLLGVTKSESRIFRPPTAKGAHKGWEDSECLSANVVELETHGVCLSCVMGNGVVKSYSIPGLKEISEVKIGQWFEKSRLADIIVTGAGYIFGWTSEAECLLLHLWGKGDNWRDTLYNPNTPVPARPTISNFQWISGTQYVTVEDVDLLIGGPERPMSRKMIEQMRAEKRQAEIDARSGSAAAAGGSNQDGVFANMAKQIQERTEKLNIMGDSMDRLGESSANFADDVSKFVNQQKRKALLGGEHSPSRPTT